MTFDYFMIATFWVLALDVFNFYEGFMSQLHQLLFRNSPLGIPPVKHIRPFSCSICMTFWCCLLYNINELSLATIFCSILASYSTLWLNKLFELLDKLMNDMR